jgi:hypothetical protein
MKRHITSFSKFSINEAEFMPDMEDYLLAMFDDDVLVTVYFDEQSAIEDFGEALAHMYSSGGASGPTSSDFMALQLRGVLVRDLIEIYEITPEELEDMRF